MFIVDDSQLTFGQAERVAYDRLKLPIWILDLDRACLRWANQAALPLWEAQHREELLNFRLHKFSSVLQGRFAEFLQAMRQGRGIQETWIFERPTANLLLQAQYSPIYLEGEQWGILVEGMVLAESWIHFHKHQDDHLIVRRALEAPSNSLNFSLQLVQGGLNRDEADNCPISAMSPDDAFPSPERYAQMQQLNTNLEDLVDERTAQLQQALEFEALLKRITDQVRDSLDETQILQSVVRELAIGLSIAGCDAGLYEVEQRTSTICYEYMNALPSALHRVVPMADFPEVYDVLLQGHYLCFCEREYTPVRPLKHQMSLLACPIVDDQQVLGDVWLFRQRGLVFNEQEIRLLQQVTNQCAISIRQARLYKAAQAQVQEMEKLNKLKDDFLSTVSHELRTPMSAIKLATQMLEVTLTQMGVLGQENHAVARYLTILQEECQREIGLINNLLDLSRLDAEDDPPQLSRVDLRIWLPYVAEPFTVQAKAQTQQLHFQIPPDLFAIQTDLSLLERVMTELLSNACKYTPSGETIVVSVHPESKSLKIKVSNSGVEIDPQEIPRIFDKFYRIPNHDPWKHGGTGLGLALVKKLLHPLDGTIQAESSDGITTFTVALPLLPLPDA
ncbi:MAG: GAF domain-containing sensor histidine kinase [Leptolyngbyaceae cyanobacterium bins.59]|nr:GAF domain-containing sensor histidine kinase [Leptolyngbyaceae cyanobacterium bins.59]